MIKEPIVRILVKTDHSGPVFEDRALSDVPRGYIQVRMLGHGLCYADPKMFKQSREPLHPEFPASIREVIRRIMTALAKVQPMTFTEWEFGFRCDQHPWREIAIYEWIVDTYQRFTARLLGDDRSTDKMRRAVFTVIVHLTTNGQAIQLPWRITSKRAKEIRDWMFSDPVTKLLCERENRMREQIISDKLVGPSRININGLFGDENELNTSAEFSPRELVASAQIIIGVDTQSQREFIVFGRPLVERIANGERLPARTLHVELDQETEDLERLVALVSVIKGRHDYQAG